MKILGYQLMILKNKNITERLKEITNPPKEIFA